MDQQQKSFFLLCGSGEMDHAFVIHNSVKGAIYFNKVERQPLPGAKEDLQD